MIKLKLFHDKTTITMTPEGYSSASGTFAIYEAQEFINRPYVELIDLKFSTNTHNETNILVMYREKEI